MLDMDMFRLGDAPTPCPEASASTLFQCAERSESGQARFASASALLAGEILMISGGYLRDLFRAG